MPYKDPEKRRKHQREYMRKWLAKNPEKAKEYRQRQSTKLRGVRKLDKKWAEEYYQKHRVQILEKKKKENEVVKMEVLTHYGHGHVACTCCGEVNPVFLAVDHVNNDGTAHRKLAGKGSAFYQWLKRHGFPNDPPLQILCFNCNFAKRIYGVCPHQKKGVSG